MTTGLVTAMVVDDNQHMRHIVKEMLRSFGVKMIEEASNGAEAFEVLRSKLIDIAVIDVSMTVLDGVEFLQMLRKSTDSPNPYLPVIALTAHTERSRVVALRDAGVTEVMAKPISAKIFMDRLNSTILRPRSFVRTSTYFGPDRRRRQDPKFKGPWRRKDDDSFDDKSD